MRHNIAGRSLNRASGHRKALYRNLVTALLKHEKISPEELKFDLDQLMGVGLIEYIEDVNGGTWMVTNFSKRQDRVQDEQRKKWRQQKQRQRSNGHKSRASSVEPDEPEKITQEINISQEEVLETSADSPADTRENVLGVRADNSTMSAWTVEDSPLNVRALEKEEEIESEKEGEENVVVNAVERVPVQVFDREDNNTTSPTFLHFCSLFGEKTLNPKQQKTFLNLEQEYGSQRLVQVIDWAVGKDIEARHAFSAVKTAIKTWEPFPRDRSPPGVSALLPQGEGKPRKRYEKFLREY